LNEILAAKRDSLQKTGHVQTALNPRFIEGPCDGSAWHILKAFFALRTVTVHSFEVSSRSVDLRRAEKRFQSLSSGQSPRQIPIQK